MVALAALSDLSLRLYPEHWCQGFGLGSLMRAASIPAGVSCGGTHGGVGSAGAGAARGQHWLWETYGFTLRVRLNPGSNPLAQALESIRLQNHSSSNSVGKGSPKPWARIAVHLTALNPHRAVMLADGVKPGAALKCHSQQILFLLIMKRS